jgi:nitrite reductase (NADH) small subunit
VISLETGKALGADQGEVGTVSLKVEGEQIFMALDAASRAA